MYAKQLKELKLDEHDKIGFTLKTLGAGFWALTQHDFRRALTDLVMEVATLTGSHSCVHSEDGGQARVVMLLSGHGGGELL